MSNIIDQTINILTTSPGNLFYHLILIFSIVMAIQAHAALKKWLPKPESVRLLLGLLFLLLMQIGLFVFGAMIWQGLIFNGRIYFPPIDRAILTLVFIWIIWLWSFHIPSKAADIIHLLLNIGVITLTVFTIRAWSFQEATVFFNSTILDWSWLVFTTIILVSGILLILVRRPKGWGAALVFLNINLIASLAHMLWASPNSDFSAFFRFSLILTFPLLPILVYRMNRSKELAARMIENDQSASVQPDDIWLDILQKNTPASFIAEIAKLSALATKSKFCLFQQESEYGDVIRFSGGFDSIKKEYYAPKLLNAEGFRAIGKALNRSKPTTIDRNALTQAEFVQLRERMGIEDEIVQWLIYPIHGKNDRLGAFILGSNVKGQDWPAQAAGFLDTIKEPVILKLHQLEASNQLNAEKESLQRELDSAKIQLKSKQDEIDNHKMRQKDLPSMVAIQEEAQRRIDGLENEKRQLDLQLQDLLESEQFLKTNQPDAEEIVMIIDRVIDHVSSYLLDRNIMLQLNLPENSSVISPHADLLEKALSNLFIYATEISQEDGPVSFTFIDTTTLNQKQHTQFILEMVSDRPSLSNKNLVFCEAYVTAMGGVLDIKETAGNQIVIKIVLPIQTLGAG